MPEQVAITAEEKLRQKATVPPVQGPKIPLEAALAQIRVDSRSKPETYFEETEIPGGGE